MVKRFSVRPYLYTVFALIVLMASWESNRTNAAIIEQSIPQESIRLRILANSDSAEDQWIKRQIRDEIIEHMNGWVETPQGIQEARVEVRSNLPDIRELVGRVLQKHGFSYSYSVELDIVPFPAKMYGNKVYPAGDYEALRVALGKGEGQNWWCVLFPPLCFVDAVSGEAVAKNTDQGARASNASEVQSKQEVRFFVLDILQKLSGFVKGFFAV